MAVSDDSVLYTGVDNEGGVFGNELVVDDVKDIQQEQDKLLSELTPQLEDIITMIDNEKALAIQFIADTVDGFKDGDEVLRGELIAAARYRKYLDSLKNMFVLKLNQTRGK